MSNKAERERQLYREVMGHEAAERQADLAARTCPGCGQRDGRHHPLCKKKTTRGRANRERA